MEKEVILKKDGTPYNEMYIKYREKILERARKYQKKKTEENRKKRALEYLSTLNINYN